MDKAWLSIPDAATKLNTNDAGVFQKALNGELTISVRFVTEGRGKKCTGVLTMSEAEGLKANELSKRLIPRGDAIKLSGVYDLPMLGAERERIEIEYLNRVNDGHDPIEITTLKSAYVQNTEGTIYELQFLLLREGVAPTIDDFRPTGSLEDIQFVVRNDVLRKL